MTNYLEDNQSQYVLAKEVFDFLVAWKAPRGNTEQERWTIDPEEAHPYKNLAAVVNAAERLMKLYPDEFKSVKALSVDEMREKAKVHNAYKSLPELLSYHPETKTFHILQYADTTLFFADKTAATKRKQFLESEGTEVTLNTAHVR